MVVVFFQWDSEVEDLGIDDFFWVGIIVCILKLLCMFDGIIIVILQGRKCFEFEDFVLDEFYMLAIVCIFEYELVIDQMEFDVFIFFVLECVQ